MNTSTGPSNNYTRTRYTIKPCDIVEILCHRNRQETEEFLVRWRSRPLFPCPPRAIASWHPLPELRDALHHVQAYIEKNGLSGGGSQSSASHEITRKRKSPEDDTPITRGLLGANGLLTPRASTRSGSPSELTSTGSTPEQRDGPQIYNGTLHFKEGSILAKRDASEAAAQFNTKRLPTEDMILESKTTSVDQAEQAIRHAFESKLKKVRRVRLENNFDSTTPNLDFTFISDYVLGSGVSGAEPNTFQGCQKCRPDMGGNVGCEYTAICECLEFANVDEQALERKNPEGHKVYVLMKEHGIDTMGLPKRFPYSKPRPGGPQTMAAFYREQRYPIYECNRNCKCGPGCKSRLVQKGRKVPLVIFKTGKDRGWGVYCEEDLIQGEFIDVYLGEVITDQESNRREHPKGVSAGEVVADKASYLYSLDKFVGDRDPMNNDKPLEYEDCYVVDGQHMGNATRFINHSCEPNIRQYTVSYNKHDLKLYSLAFFAYENIPAGTELTFDYMDKDEVELEEAIARRDAAFRDPRNEDKPRCYCGKPKCRGFLWDRENDTDMLEPSRDVAAEDGESED